MRFTSALVVSLAAVGFAISLSQPRADPAILLRRLVDSAKLSDLRWAKFSSEQPEAAKFYTARAYAPAWVRDGAPTQQALALIQILQGASAKGLDPEDYDGSRWLGRLAHLRPASTRPAAEDLVHFDLALTISALRYASDLHSGRVNPKVFCFGLDTEPKECDLAALFSRQLVDASDVGAVMDRLEPQFEGYRRTERALDTYIRLAKDDDGELLPATKKPIQPGDAYPGVARLGRLLQLLGDLPPEAVTSGGSQIYGGVLVDAVKRFQTRHGLDPDGLIGKGTLKQLNTPLRYRVRQLQLVLERWRWLPDTFSRPPIFVNIPEFRLYALDDRFQPELEMKVVVGGAYRRQTPVFSNRMTHVIFRPYWNVPLSIQRNELIPKIKKDPAYLIQNDYEIVNASDGRAVDQRVSPELLARLRSGRFAIRQTPGPKNALGYIKFMFPNEYNVYLHGTPAPALFEKSRRDFSHGCIRVEKPEELALWILRDKPGWDLERIREAENGVESLQVNLSRPIPVLIVYGTAVVRENGEVYFFDDIYGHDAALDQLLDRGYPYSDWKPTSGVCDRHRRE